MKIYLDDDDERRITPTGWERCHWPEEVITLLQTEFVEEISLDHDLGDSEAAELEGRPERTGYTVAKWIEEKVYNDPSYTPPRIRIHSANSVGRQNIERCMSSIARLLKRQEALRATQTPEYRAKYHAWYDKISTERLLNMLDKSRLPSNDEYGYSQIQIEIMKEVLASRPHLPSAKERRQAKAKERKSR